MTLPTPSSFSATDNSAAQLAREAKQLISEDLSQKLTIEEIAERLYVSRTRLCMSFKQQTGQSIGDYVKDLRIETAKHLLAETSKPIGEIAQDIGYMRQGSFSEAFKEVEGVTPNQWRKAHRPSH